MKAYINGKTVSQWSILEEIYTLKDKTTKRRLFVRRWVVDHNGKGKNERLPTSRYTHLLENREELEAFVRRLNAEIFIEQERIQKILDRTAFLNTEMIEKYRTHLSVHLPEQRNVDETINMLQRYVINVFVGKFNLINPKDWYAEEDRWYKYLLDDPEAPKSSSTKKKILNCLNRFMRWLHKERRNEVPLYEFEGPGHKRLADIERNRESNGETRERKIVKQDDWNKILEKLPDDIRPWILLCYNYGLRRNESLGLTYEGTDCVYKDYLELKKQLKKYNPKTKQKTYGKLKSQGRQAITAKPTEYRRIPHWLDVNPEETCDLIEQGMDRIMYPTTLTKRWRAFMNELGMDYDIHDLRHTWITRARAKYPSREVQLAAGHANIMTTERYSHDHRDVSETRIRPKKKTA